MIEKYFLIIQFWNDRKNGTTKCRIQEKFRSARINISVPVVQYVNFFPGYLPKYFFLPPLPIRIIGHHRLDSKYDFFQKLTFSGPDLELLIFWLHWCMLSLT